MLLHALGAVRVVDPRELTPEALAEEIRALREFRPAPVDLDFGGSAQTARLISELAGDRPPSPGRPATARRPATAAAS